MSGASQRLLALLLLAESDDSSSSSGSTSEDSSDEEALEAGVYEHVFDVMFRPPDKKPKVEHFVDDVVRQYSDEEFRRHFRLSRRVATELIAGFASSPMCPTDNHGGKAAKSAETHLLSFIWYAANKTCMRDVADRFNLAESTVHRVLQRVADYLCTLGPTVLTFPRDLEKLSRDFEKVSGVPGVVGCIDGCYIRIQCPENKIASTYVNRHHFLSMTLQAVCDNKRRFSDVLVGSSSKIHDSRVFRLSSLAKKIPGICQGGRYHILGDAAYPVRPFLLTPYRDYGALTKQKKKFNAKFSATRVLIENSFGILKKRFRQLMYLELRTVKWLNAFMLACCILHNLCIDTGDELLDDSDEEEANDDVPWSKCTDSDECEEEDTEEDAALRKLGELKREKVFQKMFGGK